MFNVIFFLQQQELLIPPTDPELLKGAPSWTNVAYNKDPVQSPSAAPTFKISAEEDAKGEETHYLRFMV